MKRQSLIILLLVIAAVALWAVTSNKINLGGGTTFFSGQTPTVEEPTGISCTNSQDCIDFLIDQGARPDIQAR